LFALVAIVFAAALFLAACSETSGGETEKGAAASGNAAAVSPSEITAAIMGEIEIPGAVEQGLSSLSLYYDIDENMPESMSLIICASGAYPDELAVFLLKDASDADTVKGFIQKRLQSQISLFRDYTPGEMYKLDGAVIGTNGRYVYFLACSDNARAAEILNGIL
jgi:hypothetical protein